jgi:conjugative coupling factor TraD (SXT/TOL subfamily)
MIFGAKKYPVECLLRPIVEFPTALVSLGAACAIALMPELFWLPHAMPEKLEWWRTLGFGQWLIAGGLALNGLNRLRQGLAIARYQRSLRALPKYEMSGDDLPFRADQLFIGQAFRWGERHTRRLIEAGREAAEPYLKPARSDKWFGSVTTGEEGGVAAMHGVGSLEKNANQPLWLSHADRMGHILVVGTNGVGKSSLAETLVSQDVRRGGPVIALDAKGDKDLMLQMYTSALLCGREKDFLCFHLAYPEFSARYNPFGNYARITEVAGRIREALPDTGNSAAFAEFAWSFVNVIAVTLNKLGRRTTIKSLLRHATNIESLVDDYLTAILDASAPSWRGDLEAEVANVAERMKKNLLPRAYADRKPETVAKVALVEKYKLVDDVAARILKTFGTKKSHHDKLVSSLFPLLQKMSTGTIADILSPDYDDASDPRPIFDFETAIRANKILYIGLDALTDATVAKAVGSSMFADITSLAGRIYNFTRGAGLSDGVERSHHPVRIHADEFSEIIGDSFVPLLNKARGAGFNVTAYTQSRADITVGSSDSARGKQVEDNFNTLILMRVRSEETAKLLVDQLPEVKVPTMMWGSASNDSSQTGVDFTSSQTQRLSEEKTKLITAANLANLPRGQAFFSGRGGQIFKVRFPMPGKSRQANIPTTIAAMSARLIATRQHTGTQPWNAIAPPWHAEPGVESAP